MRKRNRKKNQNEVPRPTPQPLRLTPEDLASERDCLGRPAWIRPPTEGMEYHTGMSRTKLYEGAALGWWRTACLRQPGCTRGTRFFYLPDIFSRLAAEAAKEATRIQQRRNRRRKKKVNTKRRRKKAK